MERPEDLNNKVLLLACLAILLVGMIAPIGWLAERSLNIGHVFNWIFRAEWMHNFTHSVLYMLLTLAYACCDALAHVSVRLAWLGGLILLVGLLHEGMQLLTRGRAFGGPELFDLVVDLFGGLVGWLIFRWHSRQTQRLV